MNNDLKINKKENVSKLLYKLNSLLIFVFTVSSVVTPADYLNIKKIAFIFLFVINLNLIFKISLKREFNVIGFHVFLFSTILFVFSVAIGENVNASISNIYLCLLASLIIVIIYKNINFEKYLLFSLTLISVIMVGSVVLDVLKILDIYDNNFLMFLHDNSEAMIGKSSIFWSYYVVFLKASSLILILLGYALFKRKYLLAILASSALLVSGTRANFFATLILITIFIFIIQKKVAWKFVTVMGFIAVVLVSFESINYYFTHMFTIKAGSGINKMEDLREIFMIFKQHPLTILFGTGFGSEDKFEIVNGTAELALFDMWRKNGLIGLTMFLFFILKPIKRLWKDKDTRWVTYSYVTYLMVAMTNPLFFSSTAYLMYIYIYIMYYRSKNQLVIVYK